MKYKNFLFSMLEKIEKKNIEKETINIKNLYSKEKQNSQQLQLLIDYKKEYSTKIQNKMILGVCIHQWKNYNDFISILQIIIKDNINEIEKNKKTIENSLKSWSNSQIKLNIWKYLNAINKKKILKIKKKQEEIMNDNYNQLKFLKKG
ncbi:flagellar FliJ protein [Buchnera aphidicola str. Ak (Acyrthosiphon kondoi)]|uniref:Flagellar FliJ protein n=1 Tax=Buchnera aphidicola str. Ak (Acyrthosiphon kondoi) TaxID=1005090 RepID=G2LMF4_9GAMM|nr:flagellar FliJ family protein [Buchnera aphidicola]AEO08442.1 flagellar FliJ protein [Buchnera aphidicola str. Ak (Acyrthosiphon kondoi)]WAI18202.1 MAG: flagellar FliJ family protein [Buchnera aphidicola (Acyrthosiphon caraganae)]